MRVGLDITQGVKRHGRGIARYIREILPHLRAPGEEAFDPVLYVRGERILRRGAVAELASGAATLWMPLPWILPGRGLDLFHSFGNHLPAVSRVPLTFTVHDLRALDRSAPGSRRGSRLHRNVTRSAGVLCLTEYGRSRLMHHFSDYDPRRMVVVPHGVDHARFRPQDRGRAQAVAERHGLRQPFLLQLGSWLPHKNLELSINAFAQSRARDAGYRLAFVGGGATDEYRGFLHELARSQGVDGRIDWVENAPGEDIPQLLAAASCLLQPSYYEGFALPLLEAMAVGTPGVVSDSSCLPEVSGGAWPVAVQDNAAAFADDVDGMVFDEQRRTAAIAAGLQRAARFTWQETARKTVAFFRTVLNPGAS